MGSFNRTAAEKLLKDVWNPEIVTMLNNEFPYLARFKDAPYKSGDGKQYLVPMKLTRGTNYSGISDGGAFPAYNPPTFDQSIVTIRYTAGTWSVTGPAISSTESSAAAVKSAMDIAREDFEESLKNRKAKHLMLDGTGIISKVSSGGGTTTLVMETTVTHGTFYLEVGEVIAFVTTAGAWRGRGTILTVDHSTNTITITLDAGAVADTDYVVYCQIDSTAIGTTDYNKAPHGLGFKGGMLDPTAVYQSVDPATVPKWAPVSVDGGAVAVNQDKLDSLFMQCQSRSGKPPKMWHANTGFVTEMRNLVEDQRRYSDNRVETGTTGVIKHSVMGTTCEFFMDRFVPPGQISAIEESCIYKFESGKPGFDTQLGGGLIKYVGEDRAVAVWKHYCTYGTDKRHVHGRLYNLTQTNTVRPTIAG